MSFSRRVLVGIVGSWIFSAILGLLFAAGRFGQFSLNTLTVPGVVPVALTVSTAVAICLAPLAIWSLRTGARNACLYG